MLLISISSRSCRAIKIVLIGAISLLLTQKMAAQVLRAGVVASAQACWVKLDDSSFRDTVSISPKPGFRVGGVLAFKVKDRYFLHTEYVYSQKGKIAKGKLDENLKDEATYSFIDVPILFTMHFKGHIGKTRTFQWFLGAGPTLSYWLSGKGKINSGDVQENSPQLNAPPVDYKIKFGKRTESSSDNDFYYQNARRFQLGLNLAAGVFVEPAPGRVMSIDLRYSFYQTQMGDNNTADIVSPIDYLDNLAARNRAIQLSVCYMFEYNTDKKSRHKGKSTIKKKYR